MNIIDYIIQASICFVGAVIGLTVISPNRDQIVVNAIAVTIGITLLSLVVGAISSKLGKSRSDDPPSTD